MKSRTSHPRLNTIRRLVEESLLPLLLRWEQRRARHAAKMLDRLRTSIGPIDIPVSELIEEGRRR
jgi:hypothetical protein